MFIENPKEFTEKLLEKRGKFCKVAGSKINISKFNVSLYSSNNKLEI